MKRLWAALLALCIVVLSVCTASAVTLTGTQESWLLVTEVAAYPSSNRDFGQLVEVYNNTDADLDLYDYEIAITTSRDSHLDVSLGAQKLRGGFYLSSEQGERVLKSGEIAVLWIVFDEAQKGYTEEVVRSVAAAGNIATPIPAGTQIFLIDTTVAVNAFGDAPYIRRDGVCYVMVNRRDGHITQDSSQCGAYARVYGQIGQGRSQLYGDVGSQSQEKWQADLTQTAPANKEHSEIDGNVPMNFGTFTTAQSRIFPIVYIPGEPIQPIDPAEAIAKLESLIAAIGEVTLENYASKKIAIESAEAARDQLGAVYGQEALERVRGLETLTAARETYDEYASRSSVVFGDINLDDSIDAQDALLALQHSVRLTDLRGNVFYAADVNDDQQVDASDALMILQYSVQLIDRFPADEHRPAGPDIPVTGLGGMTMYTVSGLPIGKAVQQFAIAEIQGETTIFVTQRQGSTAYLSRCKVAEDGKSAPCVDYAMLEGYGHAESLDISVHNGQTYIFIASDANPDSDKYEWGTTVTRLKYDAGKVSDERKITGIERATSDGSMIAEGQAAYRINFALNDAADCMVFYFRSKSGTHALAAYRLSTLQDKLDAAAQISLRDCTDAFTASTGAKKIADICPNKSFQGLAVDAQGCILVSGGTTSVKPQLTKFAVANSNITRESIVDIDWIYSETLGTKEWAEGSAFYEIESIKCYGGENYVSFNPGTAALIQNHTEVYKLVMR